MTIRIGPIPTLSITIDDGSIDGTRDVIERFARDHKMVFLKHERRLGKGAAICAAIDQTEREWLVVQDADLEYDPQDDPRLFQPILGRQTEVVYGSRRLGNRKQLRDWMNPFFHGVTVLNFLVLVLYGKRLTDKATCYKLFRTADLRKMDLACRWFGFCSEVTAKAYPMGLRIAEVPIDYSPRSLVEGKKFRFIDAIEAASTLWEYRRWLPVEKHTFQLTT